MEYLKIFDANKLKLRIKELRTEKGIYQEFLAEMLGVSQSTIAQYENGRARPSFEVLFKLAQIFDTTTDYLLGFVDFE